MTGELLSFLAAAAAHLSGYPELTTDQLPQVRVVDAGEFAARVCPKDAGACRGMAADFQSERYEIVVRDNLDLDSAADNSFLLHELVHVMQWRAHGDAIYKDCPATLQTETEAYRAQNAYLKREGQFLRYGEVLIFTTCAEQTHTVFPSELLKQNGTAQ